MGRFVILGTGAHMVSSWLAGASFNSTLLALPVMAVLLAICWGSSAGR